MRRFAVIAFVLLLSLFAFSQKKDKKKSEMPQIIVTAQFVYVTSWHGDLYDVRNLTPDDRQAIINVQDALKKWKHYRLVSFPQDADITLIVRPGALGMVQGRVGIGTPFPTGRTPGAGSGQIQLDPTFRVEGGNPNDELLVAVGGVREPTTSSFFWRRSARNGFSAPNVSLVETFKKDVEEAIKP